MPNSSPRRLAIGCFQVNQYVTLSSSVLFRTIAFQQTILPPSRALILCATARKSLKMTDFSKTGSRNTAETCAINFLTLVSYSTSIVIGGLRRLLLPVQMWAGVDLEYFAQNRQSAVFAFFPIFDHSLQKNRKPRDKFSAVWWNAGCCIDIHWNIYFAPYISPKGGAANAPFARCRDNMYK